MSPISIILTLAVATGPQAGADPKLSPDLREVSNLKSVKRVVQLEKEHLDALRKNLFFTAPAGDRQMYWVYGANDYRNIPSLVTADNVLQIMHVFFESTLRIVESEKLLPEVRALSAGMLRQAIARHRALRGGPLETAALRNVAYFGVATRLLGSKPAIPDAALKAVDAELKSIDAGSGAGASAIFPFDLDYSQFQVRGHYSKSPDLMRFFRVMMWYGLVPLPSEITKGVVNAFAPELVQQALLMARDLRDAKLLGRWDKVYGVTSLYAGPSDTLTPKEVLAVSDRFFGRNANVARFTSVPDLKAFAARARDFRVPTIVMKREMGSVAGPVQMRFMGQRSAPDSRVLQELSDIRHRPFPSPLDVMSVLGSARARQILDWTPKKHNPLNWSKYRPLREGLEKWIAGTSPSTWKSNLYWSWLDVLRTMLKPTAARGAAFMQRPAWRDKTLYGALASWAALRHHTILYAQQSVAEMGDGSEDRVEVKGYVEPAVALYRRISSLTALMKDGLSSRGYLSGDVRKQFKNFDELVRFLIQVGEKELAGRALTKKEHLRIRKIEGELGAINSQLQFIANNYQQVSWEDDDMAIAADVHTARGQALTVAIGRADHVFAIVPIEGRLVLARGSALSYYEFLQPVSQRLTDQAWRKRLDEERVPRPAWTSSFHVQKAVEARH